MEQVSLRSWAIRVSRSKRIALTVQRPIQDLIQDWEVGYGSDQGDRERARAV